MTDQVTRNASDTDRRAARIAGNNPPIRPMMAAQTPRPRSKAVRRAGSRRSDQRAAGAECAAAEQQPRDRAPDRGADQREQLRLPRAPK